KLASDHHVPAHGEDAHQGEAAGEPVDQLAAAFAQRQYLGCGQQQNRRQRAQQYLDHDVREVELGVHHEVEAAERFVRLIDAVNEVQHLKREVNPEGIEHG